MSAAAIVLPGGFWLDGVHHREAELHPLSGADEAFLLETGTLTPARRTTALLARCLTRLGQCPPVPPAAGAALPLRDPPSLPPAGAIPRGCRQRRSPRCRSATARPCSSTCAGSPWANAWSAC